MSDQKGLLLAMIGDCAKGIDCINVYSLYFRRGES
jgi:hypothetical protein